MKHRQYQQGYTFIELILYTAIVAFVLTAISAFALRVLGTSAKSNTQREVYGAARFVSERINYEIRNAISITSVSANSIVLATDTPATNPTTIALSGGVLRITQGSGAATPLHGQDVAVSSLTFTNLSTATNTSRHIRYTITMDANYPGSRQEYQESVTMEGSAEVRSY